MNSTVAWHNEAMGKKVVAALIKNKFSAEYVADKQAALTAALAAIPEGAVVALGGSVSREEIGLTAALRERGHSMINPFRANITREESFEERRRGSVADVFLASTNAVTVDGQLINVDGSGNRVAALAFGPKKVVLIVGVNKIVPDVDSGLKRLRSLAAPINNKRLNTNNPCTVTGVCINCDSPTRACNVTTITHRKTGFSDVHIIIVGEPLGY